MTRWIPAFLGPEWAERTLVQRTGLLFIAGGGGLLLLSVTVALMTTSGTPGRTGVVPAPQRPASQPSSRPVLVAAPVLGEDGAAIESMFRVGDDLLTGPSPTAITDFEHLALLRVRTILSVGGASCDIEAARARSMRVVHAPIGFDGIADTQRRVLLKGMRDLPRPLYVCSSDATQRPPAALAFALVGLGRMSGESAAAMMRSCGTSEAYKGLFTDVMAAKPVEPAALDMMDVTFVEQAKIGPWTEAMVGLGRDADALLQFVQGGHGGPGADQQALAQRMSDTLAGLKDTQPPDGKETMAGDEWSAAVVAARHLADTLKPASGGDNLDDTARTRMQTALTELMTRCDECHAAHRD